MSVCIMLKRNGKLFIGSDRMFICNEIDIDEITLNVGS